MTSAGKQKPAAAEEGTIPARTAARVAAVQALYQMDLAGTDLNDVIAEFLQERFSEAGKDETVQGADRTFFADVLRAKGIRHELDVWGHDSAHDWPWWQRQLAHHLPRFC